MFMICGLRICNLVNNKSGNKPLLGKNALTIVMPATCK